MRVIVTGSRTATWAQDTLIRLALSELPKGCIVVHGDQGLLDRQGRILSGADKIAAKIATDLGLSVEAHPADWVRHGIAAGPIRNRSMVALGADRCIAFLDVASESRGTRHCIAQAEAVRIPVEVHFFARAQQPEVRR